MAEKSIFSHLPQEDQPPPGSGFAPAGSNLTTPPPVIGGPTTTVAAAGGSGLVLDSIGRVPVKVTAQRIPMTSADPTNPIVGQIWYRTDTSQLCVRHTSTTTKRSAAFT